ncbi:nucleotidyltransferase family protein [Prochlorothrix hollandica]|uniref:nucleotidyltransferase family protein n=1 Tax=Prochlorothrix hollandica TaxID=1223 RepID=UPI001F32D896
MLAQQKPWLLATYQITRLGIFGSYARGEQRDESDIDILVEYDNAPSLYRLIELRDYLSELFAIKVDGVTRNGLKERIREKVLSEQQDNLGGITGIGPRLVCRWEWGAVVPPCQRKFEYWGPQPGTDRTN